MAQQSITLQTSDADIIAGDIIGRVSFAASNESSGSEAKWIAASIYAQATGEFTSTVNPTNLVFATSDADGVTPRYKITNVGHFLPELNTTYELGSNSFKFNNIFAATGTLDRVATTGIQLTGSASQSGLLYINNNNLISSSPNVLFSNADLASPKLIFKASGSLTPDVSLNILTTATNVASGVQTLSIQGSAGELFSITDVLDSGTIFSVNDISGLGLIEADADGTVTLVRYGTNVAVGNVVPTQKLHVAGNLRVEGAFYDSLNSPGTSGQVLVSTSGGTDWRSLGEITGVDGVGTSGYVARWIDGDTIGTGVIYDNGTNVGISIVPSGAFHVARDKDGTTNFDNMQFIATSLSNPAKGITFGVDTTNNIGIIYGRTIGVGGLGIKINGDSLWVGAGTNASVGIGTSVPSAKLHVTSSSATTTGIIVRGAAAQTADLFQVQNSAGTTLLDIDAAGSLSGVGSGIFMGRVGIGLSNPTTSLQVALPLSTTNYIFKSTSGDNLLALQTFPTSDRMQLLLGSYNGTNTPTLASIADTNTGLQLPGSDILRFVNNSIETVSIIANGNVGIGTTSPSQKLNIDGNVLVSQYSSYYIQDTLNYLHIPSGQSYLRLGGYNGIDFYGAISASDFTFTNNTLGNLAVIKANTGRVGIGISSPSTRLHIRSGTGDVSESGGLTIEGTGTGARAWQLTPTTSDTLLLAIPGLRVAAFNSAGKFFAGGLGGTSGAGARFTASTSGVTVGQNYTTAVPTPEGLLVEGRVGIGTTTPTAQLQVNAASATVTGVIVRGAASQTADFQQWQDSAGTMRASVTKDGDISFHTSSSRGLLWGTASLLFNGQNEGVQIRPYTNSYVGFSVKGQSSQSNDLTQWKNSSGSVLARVDAEGSISGVASGIFMGRVGIGLSNPQTFLHISGDAPTVGTLFRLQNNLSTNKTYFDVRIGTAGNYDDHIFFNRNGINFFGATNSSDLYLPAHAKMEAGKQFQAYNDGNCFLELMSTPANSTSYTRLGYLSGGSFRILSSYNEVFRINGSGDVGIGTTSPTQKLDVRGSAFISGALYDSNNSAGTNGQVLTSTATGTDWKSLSEITGVDGVGVSGYVSRWIDTDTIGTGIIYDNGTNVGIGTISPAAKLNVIGEIIAGTESGTVIRSIGANNSDLTLMRVSNGTNLQNSGDYGFSIKYMGTRSGNENSLSVFSDNQVNTSQIEALTILQDGKIGVGVTNPSVKLEIGGDLNIGYANENVNRQIVIHSSNPANKLGIIQHDGSSLNILYSISNQSLNLGTSTWRWTNGVNYYGGSHSFYGPLGASPIATISAVTSGVGINTTSPTARFHVETNAATATGVIVRGAASQTADLFQVQNSAGTTLLDIDAAGSLSGVGSGIFMQRVGIGTANPQATLDVNGGILIGASQYIRNTGIFYIDAPSDTSTHGFFFRTGSGYSTSLRIQPNGNIGIGTTNPQYLLDVSGTIRANHVTAITKSFLIEHPTKPGKQLRYASLEGPENGIYIRGITTDNEIELPEYWAELVDLRSITVDLTALKYPQPNLCVEKITSRSIKIGSDRPVMASYTVYGERKDVPKLEVEC